MNNMNKFLNCELTVIFTCEYIAVFIAPVKIGVHSKYQTGMMSWTINHKCESPHNLTIAPNGYFEKECNLVIGLTYPLICISNDGIGWNSSFIIIENKAYCNNFDTGFTERPTPTITIEGNQASLI